MTWQTSRIEVCLTRICQMLSVPMLTWRRLFAQDGDRPPREKWWLPFLDTYRTFCFAPPPEFRRVLGEVRAFSLAD